MKKFLFCFAVAKRRRAKTHLIILDSVQKKLEFQPKGTAKIENHIFRKRFWKRKIGQSEAKASAFAKIKEVNEKHRTAIMVVEHNIKSLLNIANRGYVLDKGKVVAKGASQKLIESRAWENGLSVTTTY